MANDTKNSESTAGSTDNGRFLSKFSWWLPMAALSLVAIGLFIGLGIGKNSAKSPTATTQNQPEKTQTAHASMAVEAITPSMVTVENGIDANGLIAAHHTAEVSGRITGAAIEQVLVEVGDTVRAGQVLAVLDTSSLKDNHTQAIADLDQAIASAQKAHADLARTEPLLALDAISRQEVDAYRTAVKQADATVIAAKAKVNNAATSLNNAKITAPISGVISERQAQVGVLVSGNPLFTIIKDGALEWQATLSPDDAAKIRIGQDAIINAGDGQITGKVIRLSPTANQGREITVHVALPQGAPLSAGMYQTGKFILNQSNSLAVPKSAITSTDGYDYVWTLHAKNEEGLYQVSRTKVQIISYQGDLVAVAGLPADVMIVARSVEFLSENDTVKVANTQNNTISTQGQ